MDVPTKNPATSAVTYTADNKIQQVENPPEGARFLQIVAKPISPPPISHPPAKTSTSSSGWPSGSRG
jgi:hypothetical protein